MTRAREIIKYMESLRNDEQRRILMGFFKTGPGEYAYGDELMGITPTGASPCVRVLAPVGGVTGPRPCVGL